MEKKRLKEKHMRIKKKEKQCGAEAYRASNHSFVTLRFISLYCLLYILLKTFTFVVGKRILSLSCKTLSPTGLTGVKMRNHSGCAGAIIAFYLV